MILATDVQYHENKGFAAGVLFERWEACKALGEFVSEVEVAQDYIPGQFYKRELPCILSLLEQHALAPSCIVIDGYVFLDGKQEPGLGKHLYDALGGNVAIIGVAKSQFDSIGDEYQVMRGRSLNPLYVTVIGDSLENAKKYVAAMCGEFRMPALLKRADALCRSSAERHLLDDDDED